MAIHFKVLGCSGSEVHGVHPCSFLLGDSVLFDAGSAATCLTLDQQNKVDTIFLSHSHLDHVKDLAFIAENVFGKRQHPIEVCAAPAVLQAIREHLFNAKIWPDFTELPSDNQPVMRFRDIEAKKSIDINSLPGTKTFAVEVNHPGPTYGYIIEGDKGRVVYVGDTGPTEEIWQVLNELPGVDHVLLETTFPNRLGSLANVSQHLTVEMMAEEMKKLKHSEATFHIYHTKLPYHEEVLRELHECFGDQFADNGKVRLLKPGDSFEIA